MRDYVLFFINGREHRVRGADVFTTLSNYLRRDLGATGTKVVCEEGDCGACTVLLGRSEREDIAYRAVNSCIQSLFQLDCTSVVTVEGLKIDGKLNPVQEAMVACHGAQCGYCTPGFVVAMTALYEDHNDIDEDDVRLGLTGNLCRCTGYEPIIKAALAVDGTSMPRVKQIYPPAPMLAAFAEHRGVPVSAESDGRSFFAPTSIEEAVRVKREHTPVIVQGGTDVGVWINKRGFTAPAMMSLANIRGLDTIETNNGTIVAGGRVTLTAFEEFVRERIPQLHQILRIFGSPQIRNAGTLAGNIANGSPIADTLPLLFVSEAQIELTSASGTRLTPINSFYLGYKKFEMRPDEIITRVILPVPPNEEVLRLYKVSRRRDLDISSFTAAIRLSVSGERIDRASIAYGGVGPVVLRLRRTEEFLSGKNVSLELFEEAGRIARTEVTPISDVRGSKDYRLRLAENILSKFYYEAFEHGAR